MVVASVHKYWTSAWVMVADDVDLLEMIKMAEMSTARSHILNSELYKVLAMKVDELRLAATNSKDIDELHSDNKIIHSRLAFSEDARAQAEFKINKSETIQRLFVNARK
ncbi:hypothetical protein Fot_48489 [Forsythia ovata]|uniref:Uncharacterized protein n=1 Tax=Forsythia ovata TaxID=205694 RepID=A0ABD1Q976_9LAMI